MSLMITLTACMTIIKIIQDHFIQNNVHAWSHRHSDLQIANITMTSQSAVG